MDTIKINKKNVKMVAHRGVSGLERENTASAFVAAGNRSYYGIETDVRNTKDGEFVLLHDDNTMRCAGEEVYPEKTDFAELRKIVYFDSDGEKHRGDLIMPTPEEYTRICKKYQKVGVLELKGAYTEERIAELVRRIKEIGWLDGIIFISFSLDNLIKMRKLLPEQPIQWLTCEVSDEVIKTLKEYKLDLDVLYTKLTAENTKQLHDNGILVNCWTVDKPEDAEMLVSYGVDFITSNILE